MNLDTTQLVALAAALGWASGLRLYAVEFFADKIPGLDSLRQWGRRIGSAPAGT